MRQIARARLSWISLLLILIFLVASLPASAQDTGPADALPINPDGVTEGFGTATMPAPVFEQLDWSATMPELTPEQQKQLDASIDLVNRPGPERQGAEAEVGVGPEAGTETLVAASLSAAGDAPAAPGDAQLYRNKDFGSSIPSGYKSSVLEASVGQNGRFAFFTGNWFAARSTNSGINWTYVNAYSGFSDFCCDQVTTYDEARNRFYWLRMGSPNGAGVNKFRLGVSGDGGASFCNYDVTPQNVNSGWTNQWWDYPHIQLGADYMYLAWNMFNAAGNWTRTVMLRYPLDSLSSCSSVSFNYWWTNAWFTVVPVEGADHVMYFASNYPLSQPYNRIAIWRWAENSTTISSVVRTIAAWSYTVRGQAVCGSSSGNWAARTDDRLLTGARYRIQGTNVNSNGRTVLGWWWNVKQGGNFPRPYVDAAAFYEDTLTQVGGSQGRPYMYNTSECLLYPSVSSNKRGDLGVVVHFSTGSTKRPSVYFGIADDFVGAPPGFAIVAVRTSNARPSDNKWGDYNTVRRFNPVPNTWVAASHYISQSSNCATCSSPVYFTFGRARDRESWIYWSGK
jgi:hypothetical protein